MAKVTAATVRRKRTTATKRAWLSRFMAFHSGPNTRADLVCRAGRGGTSLGVRRSLISNFAATPRSNAERLSRADRAISKIIETISNRSYVFREVAVEFGSLSPFLVCGLREFRKATLGGLEEGIPASEGELCICGREAWERAERMRPRRRLELPAAKECSSTALKFHIVVRDD